MGQCDICGTEETPAHNCNYCNLTLCSDHRLPEKHNCAGLSKSPSGGHFESDAPTIIGRTSDLTEKDSEESPTPESADLDEKLPGKTKEPTTDSSPPVRTKSDSSSDDEKYGYEAKKERQQNQGGLLSSLSNLLGTIILAPVILLDRLLGKVKTVLRSPASVLLSWQGLLALFVIGTVILAVGIGVDGVTESIADGASSGAAALGNATDSTVDEEQLEGEIHAEINERRQQRGLEPLSHDEQLRKIARNHSEDMVARDYFGHTGPDGNGFEERYAAAGYDCRVSTGTNTYLTGGENIAFTFADADIEQPDGTSVNYNNNETAIAEGIVDGWMNSPGHRENILTADFEREGIGVALTEENGNTKVLVTQNFC